MKVLLLNTSDRTGGAAIACYRLMDALNANGVEAKMLVRDKITDNPNVVSVNTNGWTKLINLWLFLWERLIIFFHNGCSKRNLFRVSIANTGNDISKHPLVQEADIIHLHWINQGFLSLKDIGMLAKLGKPIVWTMHDQWPYTGICHYVDGCKNYTRHCHQCPQINRKSGKDLSSLIFIKKKNIFQADKSITLVGCSNWIAKCAKESAILGTTTFVTSIPNAINTIQYQNFNSKDSFREKFKLPKFKKFILFGACKATDKRKGVDFMIAACKQLLNYSVSSEVAVVVFGSKSEELSGLLDVPVINVGFINNSDQMVSLYNAVDLFLIPSLEDNLPNTIMEAMACGLPCVGFNTGGIPEMIDHKVNGYVANYKDAIDLTNGIRWVLEESDYVQLSQNARKKIEECYCEAVVAQQHKELYQKLWHETET